jgi:hypothetical protein
MMWDRWQKRESLAAIMRLFDREHSSIEGIIRETCGYAVYQSRADSFRRNLEWLMEGQAANSIPSRWLQSGERWAWIRRTGASRSVMKLIGLQSTRRGTHTRSKTIFYVR